MEITIENSTEFPKIFCGNQNIKFYRKFIKLPQKLKKNSENISWETQILWIFQENSDGKFYKYSTEIQIENSREIPKWNSIKILQKFYKSPTKIRYNLKFYNTPKIPNEHSNREFHRNSINSPRKFHVIFLDIVQT